MYIEAFIEEVLGWDLNTTILFIGLFMGIAFSLVAKLWISFIKEMARYKKEAKENK